jgi:hypothetical protein
MQKKLLNFQIDGLPSPAISLFSTAFSLFAIASGFVASLSFRGRINSILDNRGAGLRKNMWDGLRYRVLGQRIRQNRSWKGRYLHRSPEAFFSPISSILDQLWRRANEQIINHSMLYCVLDKYLKRLNDINFKVLSGQGEISW